MDKLAERGFECSEGVTSFYNMVGAREIEIDFNTQNYSDIDWQDKLLAKIDSLTENY